VSECCPLSMQVEESLYCLDNVGKPDERVSECRATWYFVQWRISLLLFT
jgi:hypothetical protein